MSNPRWSEEDDSLLRTMAEAGKSMTLMTVKLNRPMASIRSRAHELGINIPGTEIRAAQAQAVCLTASLLRRFVAS